MRAWIREEKDERYTVYQLTKIENGEQKDGIYGILKRVKTKTHKLT